MALRDYLLQLLGNGTDKRRRLSIFLRGGDPAVYGGREYDNTDTFHAR